MLNFMNNTVQKKNPERQFLHDLASPLGTAMLLTEIIKEDIQKGIQNVAEGVENLESIYKALEKIKFLIHERREILMKSEEMK